MLQSPLGAFFAHDPCQRADGGFGNIRDLEQGRIQFVSGTHAAENGRSGSLGGGDQRQLGSNGVYGVHNIVILGKIKVVCGVGAIEDGAGGDMGIRIDGQHPLPGSLSLGHAHSVEGCQKLAVDIGQTDGVVVDEIQSAYAAAGQGFHGIAAHTAQTEHGHTAIFQFLHCGASQQKPGAGKGIHKATSGVFCYFIMEAGFLARSLTIF